jgi:hypothetical protein
VTVASTAALSTARTVPFLDVPTREAGRIAIVVLQLGLAGRVVHQFQLESRTFFHIMLLGVVG